MSYQGHSLGLSYPFAKKQSVYSTDTTDTSRILTRATVSISFAVNHFSTSTSKENIFGIVTTYDISILQWIGRKKILLWKSAFWFQVFSLTTIFFVKESVYRIIVFFPRWFKKNSFHIHTHICSQIHVCVCAGVQHWQNLVVVLNLMIVFFPMIERFY